MVTRQYNQPYTGEHLNRVAFPMGGIGAGMICLEGTGALSHFSLRNRPDLFNEPCIFSAVSIKGEERSVRVLEGPVPSWKIFGNRGTGLGAVGSTYGFPRFASASFDARFPFGIVSLEDPRLPIKVEITGWSPFIPGDPDNSSLPAVGLEYRLINTSDREVELVYSFNAKNFMSTRTGGDAVLAAENGFTLWQPGSEEKPEDQGAFTATVLGHDATVNCAWFRGGWFDPLSVAWKHVQEGAVVSGKPLTTGGPSPGGSLYVPLSIAPGESETVRLLFTWHVPRTTLRTGDPRNPDARRDADDQSATSPRTYSPWYAGRFSEIQQITSYWREHYDELRNKTESFTDCFYSMTLPPEVIEAVATNLCILKSPTVLRQRDGRFWAWEGSNDEVGSCPGSCTHVWNYQQALPHLFPSLERSLRETEFFECQDENGHQTFRAPLPIRKAPHEFHAAADGQLGGIMKVYREWRISGDTDWLRRLWPKIRASMDYCIETWDPDRVGALIEPHHNTYDIEFWGPDGMCTSFYLGALKAMVGMGEYLGEDVSEYNELLERGQRYMEQELFDGEYFYQKVQWKGLRAGDPTKLQSMGSYSPEAAELLQIEGPKYQYGTGCLSDGVLGAWIAEVCGVGSVLDRDKVRSHLKAVHKYNLKRDLSEHSNPQRPSFATGTDGGLLLCSWPKGGRPTLPFVYSDEVWTGIEYQVASHLLLEGLVDEGLEIVRTCRDRYDGRVRNPFDEYECGHWYARAMASYGLLQGLGGVRYDAVDKTFHIAPTLKGDFSVFFATETGYGLAGVKDGKPFVDIKSGRVDIQHLAYQPR